MVDASIVGRSLGWGGRWLCFPRKLLCVLFVSYLKDETACESGTQNLMVSWQKYSSCHLNSIGESGMV